jgi:hypothetical protein
LGKPISTGRATFAATTNSRRMSRPEKNSVWLGIPGSSPVPRTPSAPGAQATSRHGPSEAFIVVVML